jgi:hypothetical protein
MQKITARRLRFEQSVAATDSILTDIQALLVRWQRQQTALASVISEQCASAQTPAHQCTVMERMCRNEHAAALRAAQTP